METQNIIQFDTSLDHLTGEETGQALDALNDNPLVLDAILLQGIGKKNRPAGLLQVLCLPENAEGVLEQIFVHTHTLGVRKQKIERIILPRKGAKIKLGNKEVAAKEYSLGNVEYCRPEADGLRRLAREENLGAPALRLKKPDDDLLS